MWKQTAMQVSTAKLIKEETVYLERLRSIGMITRVPLKYVVGQDWSALFKQLHMWKRRAQDCIRFCRHYLYILSLDKRGLYCLIVIRNKLYKKRENILFYNS